MADAPSVDMVSLADLIVLASVVQTHFLTCSLAIG